MHNTSSNWNADHLVQFRPGTYMFCIVPVTGSRHTIFKPVLKEHAVVCVLASECTVEKPSITIIHMSAQLIADG